MVSRVFKIAKKTWRPCAAITYYSAIHVPSITLSNSITEYASLTNNQSLHPRLLVSRVAGILMMHFTQRRNSHTTLLARQLFSQRQSPLIQSSSWRKCNEIGTIQETETVQKEENFLISASRLVGVPHCRQPFPNGGWTSEAASSAIVIPGCNLSS